MDFMQVQKKIFFLGGGIRTRSFAPSTSNPFGDSDYKLKLDSTSSKK